MSRLTRTRALAAIAAVTAALTLAACTAPGSSSSSSSTTGAKSSSSVAGDLHYALYQQPDSFNPFTSLNGADGQIAGLQYRPLMLQGPKSYLPVLASSWSSNSDATVWTFHLANTKWSDGTPFTSADVVYSFDTYTNPATKSTYSSTFASVVGAADFIAGKAKDISGIAAPDDHTVKITLTAPNAAFIGSLPNLNIVPKHVFESIDPATFTGNQAFHQPTVGIGPYVVSQWVNASELEFVPNKYSQEKHPLAHLYAEYEASSTAEAQLQTGEVDIAPVAAADASQLKGEGVDVVSGNGTSVLSLWTALDNGLLANQKVRQAILYAIDRQSIVKNVLAGQATVPQTMIYAASATPKDLTTYNYDPTKAKELLKEASWNPSTEVDLDIVPGQADRDAIMTIVAGELQAVGINAKVKQLQPAQVSALTTTDRKDMDLLITVLSVNPVDPGATISQRYTTNGTLNISKYSNSQVDTLTAQALATPDTAKRDAIYQKINKIINDEVPSIPLVVEKTIWGTTPRVHGLDPATSTATALTFAQEWSVSSK